MQAFETTRRDYVVGVRALFQSAGPAASTAAVPATDRATGLVGHLPPSSPFAIPQAATVTMDFDSKERRATGIRRLSLSCHSASDGRAAQQWP